MKKAEVCPPYFSNVESIISASIMSRLVSLLALLSKFFTIPAAARGEMERVMTMDDTQPNETRTTAPIITGDIDRELDEDPVVLNV